MELLSEMQEALSARDVGYFSNLASNGVDGLNKVPEVMADEVRGIATSVLSLINKAMSRNAKKT
jgi:hypothetical protein